MGNDYFNQLEFKKATKLMENNPYEAVKKLAKYISKYPKDYSIYPYYASTLITIGEFKKAQNVLDYIEKMVNQDSTYIYSKRFRYFKKNLLFTKLKLLCHQERYENAYCLLVDHGDYIRQNDNSVDFYIKNKLKIVDIERQVKSYLFRQIIEYQEEDFLNHIQKHLFDSNQNDVENSSSLFIEHFPITEVIEEIKKYIPSSKALYSYLYTNKYIFKYNECGRAHNKIVDYFVVTCFHNTKDIITMFPSQFCEALPYVDLNYLVKEKDEVKVKRMSQIEKFNKRYNRN